jgi:hypothetical protein
MFAGPPRIEWRPHTPTTPVGKLANCHQADFIGEGGSSCPEHGTQVPVQDGGPDRSLVGHELGRNSPRHASWSFAIREIVHFAGNGEDGAKAGLLLPLRAAPRGQRPETASRCRSCDLHGHPARQVLRAGSRQHLADRLRHHAHVLVAARRSKPGDPG